MNDLGKDIAFYYISINKTKTVVKVNGDQAFLFVVALKKAVWNILIRVFFNFFFLNSS